MSAIPWPLTLHPAILPVPTQDYHLCHLHLLPFSSQGGPEETKPHRLGLSYVLVVLHAWLLPPAFFLLTYSSQCRVLHDFAPLVPHSHPSPLQRRRGRICDCPGHFPSTLSSCPRGSFCFHLHLTDTAEWVNKGITGGTTRMLVRFPSEHPLRSGPGAW